jgi:hypothetical protein
MWFNSHDCIRELVARGADVNIRATWRGGVAPLDVCGEAEGTSPELKEATRQCLREAIAQRDAAATATAAATTTASGTASGAGGGVVQSNDVAYYVSTPSLPSGGSRIRAGPSTSTAHIGSINPSQMLYVVSGSETAGSASTVWVKMHACMYESIRGSYNFSPFDAETQGFVMLKNEEGVWWRQATSEEAASRVTSSAPASSSSFASSSVFASSFASSVTVSPFVFGSSTGAESKKYIQS